MDGIANFPGDLIHYTKAGRALRGIAAMLGDGGGEGLDGSLTEGSVLMIMMQLHLHCGLHRGSHFMDAGAGSGRLPA